MSPGQPGPGAGRTNAKYGPGVYLMLASAVLNGLLVVALLWVVGQVGIRTSAEEVGIVEPRRPVYDTYAAEQFDGHPDAAGDEWSDPTEALSSPDKLRRDGAHLTGGGYETTRERIATPTDVSRSLAFDP